MFSLPLAVFLLHNFIGQLPESLIEAARVDGGSHLRIFRSIVLPLSTPAIASFGIFQFLWVWNDLLVAKTFGGSDAAGQPITARIQNLAGNFGAHQELLAPAAFIAIVIPLIVFLCLRRFFVRGLLAGSVKGLACATIARGSGYQSSAGSSARRSSAAEDGWSEFGATAPTVIDQPARVVAAAVETVVVPSERKPTLNAVNACVAAPSCGATTSTTSTDPYAPTARRSIEHMAVHWSSIRAASRTVYSGSTLRTAAAMECCGECPMGTSVHAPRVESDRT
jgi:hypothetical protein